MTPEQRICVLQTLGASGGTFICVPYDALAEAIRAAEIEALEEAAANVDCCRHGMGCPGVKQDFDAEIDRRKGEALTCRYCLRGWPFWADGKHHRDPDRKWSSHECEASTKR